MAETAATDPFGLDTKWRAATDRIIKMMASGVVSSAPLRTGPSSTVGIERYARAICDTNPQADLGLMYGLCSVATTTATQGAYILRVPKAQGGYLDVPCIQYLIGIAPSGYRKSDALDVAQVPLEAALEHGEAQRRRDLPYMQDLAQRDGSARLASGTAEDPKQYMEVYHSGLCPETTVKDPTVEAIRDLLVMQGGVASVWAGEPDVFTNINHYSPNGEGSMTFLLDGWMAANVKTMRVGRGMLRMDQPNLTMCVLFQTDRFADVTSGGTNGADSYMERGMFGRFMVVEATGTGGWDLIAAAYPDDADWFQDRDDPDGVTDKHGVVSPLGRALRAYRQALDDLVMETNSYRLHKALRHGWLAASTKYGNALQVPEIFAEERTAFLLGPEALVEYNRIQRMYSALQHWLTADNVDDDIRTLWQPLVARFVQHVLREALTITLAAGKREVTAETLRDAALRITPWRWGLWCRALTKRNLDRVEDVIAASSKENNRQDDLSPEAKVFAVMVNMAKREPERREYGWTASEIARKATSTINPKRARVGVHKRLVAGLEALAADPDSGITKVEWGDTGRFRYQIKMTTVENHRRG